MAGYEIRIKPSAARELDSLPSRQVRQRIVERIARLAADPRPPGCQKLTGQDRYRVRQGRYRIVYEIQDRQLVVYVVKIGDRKDVYR